ncbi:oligosaccharide flippase family protein [Parafilimonas sp.]|uniref:oligosaccharide flippase family protein n=1 Tax=Parafilimonas sp. TaxID=1969739 RepID=UPI0039E55F4E
MKQGKHSLIYFLGRGLTGLVNFFAITIYTRLLVPSEYGVYALVSASVTLFNTVLYQWLRLVLLRFLPKSKTEEDQGRLYASISLGFVLSSLLSVIIAAVYYFFNREDKTLSQLLLFGVILLWFEAFFEISLEYFRSNLKPTKYAAAFIVKSVAAILLGSTLAYFHMGAWGLIVGILSADIIVSLIFFRPFISRLASNFRNIDNAYFKTSLRFGLPITLSYAMTFIINSSDRYFIKYYMGDSATGMYAVGYDLARQSLWVIMTSMNLASYPLAVRALEQHGVEEANVQLSDNFILLIAVSLPAAIGMAVLADRIAEVFVGRLFIKEVTVIVPMIAIGSFVAGLKNFYIDQSFQLGKKTHLQIWSVIAAAAVNVILNIVLIPSIGIMGAIYSTLASFAIALVVSCMVSRFSYTMPFPKTGSIKILIASVLMGAGIYFLKAYIPGKTGLFVLVFIGLIIYCLILSVSGILKVDLTNKKVSFNYSGN